MYCARDSIVFSSITSSASKKKTKSPETCCKASFLADTNPPLTLLSNFIRESRDWSLSTIKRVASVLPSFTTKIYTKDTARQNNVALTCSKLNGTQIQNGQTFSFCNTIGPATSAKGYQEADIFDNDGNKKKGLGGGNCQVSTTLYNAVLKLNDIISLYIIFNKLAYIYYYLIS